MNIYKGMNIKVVNSQDCFWHSVGEEYEIEGLLENTKFIYVKGGGISYDNYMIIMDDTFLQKFKYEKIVVSCDQEADAKRFCDWMATKGLVTNSSSFPPPPPQMKIYREDIFYVVNFWGDGLISHNSSGGFYERAGYTIINYKELIEEKVMDNKFGIGEKVIIKNVGKNYSTFERLANKLGAMKYVIGGNPVTNLDCKVVNFDVHDDGYTIVYLVDSGDNQYLIGEDGLTKKERKKMNNKFEVGERVIIQDTGKNYSTYTAMAEKLGATKYMDRRCPVTNLQCRVVDFGGHSEDVGIIVYLVDDGDNQYLMGEDGLVTADKKRFKVGDTVKIIGNMANHSWLVVGDLFEIAEISYQKEEWLRPEKGKLTGIRSDCCKVVDSFKILKPFTLKDIFDKNPCNSDGELWRLMDEYKERNLSYDMVIHSWDLFRSFKTLMEYKKWFIEEGFIEEAKKKFEPFKLTLDISSKKELESLWCMLNISNTVAKGGEQRDFKYDDYRGKALWERVNKEMWRVEC